MKKKRVNIYTRNSNHDSCGVIAVEGHCLVDLPGMLGMNVTPMLGQVILKWTVYATL